MLDLVAFEDAKPWATDLGLDIKNTPPPRARHILNGHKAGAVEIAGELSVFDKCTIENHLLELFLSDKVVVFSINLSWTWRTRCICIGKLSFGLIVFRFGFLRETLNPNLVG